MAGENIIAFDLDRLLRGERRQGDADVAYTRAEAARILLTASSHAGVNAEDRAYLTRLVAARTGLGQPDAERRVDTAIARAKDDIARTAQHSDPGVHGRGRRAARRSRRMVCGRRRRPAPGQQRAVSAMDRPGASGGRGNETLTKPRKKKSLLAEAFQFVGVACWRDQPPVSHGPKRKFTPPRMMSTFKPAAQPSRQTAGPKKVLLLRSR